MARYIIRASNNAGQIEFRERLTIDAALAKAAELRDAGFQVLREELHVTSTFRSLPFGLGRWFRDSPLVQDIVISSIEYVLTPRGATP